MSPSAWSARKENGAGSSNRVVQDAGVFEDALKTCEASELLRLWTRYVSWSEEHGGKDLALLRRACYELVDRREFVDHPEHLQLWVLYADRTSTPLEVFQFLRQKRVGLQLALFYEALAAVFERARQFEDAEATFLEGLHADATPSERLRANFEAFRRRMRARKRRHEGITSRSAGSHASSASSMAPFVSSDLPLRAKRSSDSPCRSVAKSARQAARSSVSSATETNGWHLLCQDATVSSISSRIPNAMFDDPTYTLEQMNREVLAIITGEDTETVSAAPPTGAQERPCNLSLQAASGPRPLQETTATRPALQEIPQRNLFGRLPLTQSTQTAPHYSCLETMAAEHTVDFERVNRVFDERRAADADACLSLAPSAGPFAASSAAGGLEIYEDSDMAIPRPSAGPFAAPSAGPFATGGAAGGLEIYEDSDMAIPRPSECQGP